MNPHPLDPVALVSGVIAIAAGIIGILHQSGAISLGLPLVIILSLIAVGVGGASLVLLEARRER